MIDEILINFNDTVYSAFYKLQKTRLKCLIVIDQKKKLLGTLTDGDLRRGLLKNIKTTSKINNCYKKNCNYFFQSNFDRNKSNIILEKKNVTLIPIVNKNKKVIDYYTNIKKNTLENNNKDLQVVVMAGGLGSRLRPYTNFIPKPLLPYKDKTLIEHVIQFYNDQKIKNFWISLNYKDKLIKSFLNNSIKYCKINFLNENMPLGTAGVLKKLQNKNKIFLVSNCDSLIDYEVNDLFDYHKKNNYDLTIITALQENKIPYGVCKIKKGKMQDIEEKPTTNYLANTGVYMINSDVLKYLKKDQPTSFVDLIKKLLKKKKKIGAYTIFSKSWKDLGQSINDFN